MQTTLNDAADAADAKQAEELTRVLDCIDAGTDPYPHSRA